MTRPPACALFHYGCQIASAHTQLPGGTMPAQEKRVVLQGSERVAMPGAREVGPADPKERIEVTVFLRRGSSPKKLSAASSIGKLPPAQRQHLSRTQFAAVYGARLD